MPSATILVILAMLAMRVIDRFGEEVTIVSFSSLPFGSLYLSSATPYSLLLNNIFVSLYYNKGIPLILSNPGRADSL